LHKQMVNYKP